MVRVLLFLAALLLIALGLSYVADLPGSVTLSLAGQSYEVSLLVALVVLALLAFLLTLCWNLLSLGVRLPSVISERNRWRRRNKGIAAISRGMIAVGSGDARGARQEASEADRLLGREPLTLLLKAQAAQLSGERAEAEDAFTRMLETDEMRVLGLRGLYVEARRREDHAAARRHATEAHKLAPTVPWASRSVLEYATIDRDWPAALAAVERSASRHVLTRAEANRLRAVLMTAQAMDLMESAPDESLRLARAALKLEAGFTPAALIAGRRLADRGDFGKASKVLETSFKVLPHPEIAEAYVDVRRGDSALDRLKRAKVLLRQSPGAREARFIVARTALDAREFTTAREQLEALVVEKPTARACLLMAELEDREHSRSGPAREWLARASRAPRDPVWVADGHVSERWAPVSPLTGQIDAYRWREPPQPLEASLRAKIDVEHFRSPELDAPAVSEKEPEVPGEQPAPATPDGGGSAAERGGEQVGASEGGEMSAARERTRKSTAAQGNGSAASHASSASSSAPHERKTAGGAEAPAKERPREVAQDVPYPQRVVRNRRPLPIVFPVSHAPDDPGLKD